jgi:diacylglycerol kinase family enzyme
MSTSSAGPSTNHRLSAIASIVLVVAVVLFTVLQILDEPVRVVGEGVMLVLLVAAVWVALTRVGTKRLLAVVVGIAVAVTLLASLVNADGVRLVSIVVRILALALAVSLAHHALGTTIEALSRAQTPGEPVPAAARGVLFMNLKSGGGKAETNNLVAECEQRGIEPVVLEAGMDWLETVREKAQSGVDVLGMAGGDGSQAMVGTVAAEFGLPMVVVPAGTRNHLALDLGLDRDDVVGALDAYGEAVEREMDLADVNGEVFVNNVSLGLYAAIVRSPDYRDAKVDTTLSTLPEVLGPEAEPFDLRFTGPDGVEHPGAHVVQVSNNPYGSTVATQTSRPAIDTHELGIVSVVLDKPGGAAGFLACLATGHPERFEGFNAWSTPLFEVTSDGPIDVGLDGETHEMEPPLRFSIRPTPVRVRLPHHAIGYSPAARAMGWRESLRQLWGVVRGRPTRFHN